MPKIIDHDERRREIVQVARRLIVQGGFEAATMRSIATEAGFANGALKHYFAGKDAIVEATFETVLTEIGSGLEQVGEAESLERVRAYLLGPLPLDEGAISAGRVLLALWEYAMSSPTLADRYRQHLETWTGTLASLIADARRAGAVRATASDRALAIEAVNVNVGATVLSLMFPSGELVPDYRDYVERFVARLEKED